MLICTSQGAPMAFLLTNASIPVTETNTWLNLKWVIQGMLFWYTPSLIKKTKKQPKTFWSERCYQNCSEVISCLIFMEERNSFTFTPLPICHCSCRPLSSFLMLLCLVSKFTANLGSSSMSHFQRRWSFRSRRKLLSPGYPGVEVSVSRACTRGGRQSHCAHVL